MAGGTSQRQHITTVSGVTGTWASLSGGKPSKETTQAWDGGADKPEVLLGSKQYSDLTVSRPFKRARDFAIGRRLDRQIGRQFVIRREWTDEDLVRTRQVDQYVGILTAVNDPDNDASSAATATFELVFAVTDRR
jgi:hypothetical protein